MFSTKDSARHCLALQNDTLSHSAANIAADFSSLGNREQDHDAALLVRIARGDAAALRALYDYRGAFLFSLCRRVLKDDSEAEDALEEVFWEIWKRSDRYESARGSGINYLLTLTRSRAIDRLRNCRRLSQPIPNSNLPSGAMDCDGSARVEQGAVSDPLEDAQAQEIRAAVRQAIDSLPVEQREALHLAYFDGMTQSQIARKLSQPLGTVKTRMRCGLVHLKKMLTPLIKPGADTR